MFSVEQLFQTVDIEHVWMFLTDKCNLDCRYCFFKHRTKKQTLSLIRLQNLWDCLSRDKRYCFVISGGEPLIEWELLTRIVRAIETRFHRGVIVLQTNGILLDRAKTVFLKEHGVVVEHGIDGAFLTSARYRLGTSRRQYQRVLDSIRLVLSQGIPVNPTMAVHPHEAGRMYDNFLYLVSLGLYSIDVHPAIFEPWRRASLRVFQEAYVKILKYELAQKKRLVCKEYSLIKGFRFDLVVMPDGNVVPNWVYLNLPAVLRKKFSFLTLRDTGVEVHAGRLKTYLQLFTRFYKRPQVSYRGFSNFNAAYMLRTWNDQRMRMNFIYYRKLTEWINDQDRKSFLSMKG